MTRDDIQNIINQIPGLNTFGIGVSETTKPTERQKTLEDGKQRLLGSVEECTKCCNWLSSVEKTKTPVPATNSYGLKHVAEEDIGYISNGAFIVAAVQCGFEYRVVAGDPNVDFGMSRKSIRSIKRRQNAEGKTAWVI